MEAGVEGARSPTPVRRTASHAAINASITKLMVDLICDAAAPIGRRRSVTDSASDPAYVVDAGRRIGRRYKISDTCVATAGIPQESEAPYAELVTLQPMVSGEGRGPGVTDSA